jgi:hypothetical protein
MNTMGEAIALSSPSGRMSKRARKAANERLRKALFGDGLARPTAPQPTEKERKLRQARELRELANRGMAPRKHRKLATKLEQEALVL